MAPPRAEAPDAAVREARRLPPPSDDLCCVGPAGDEPAGALEPADEVQSRAFEQPPEPAFTEQACPERLVPLLIVDAIAHLGLELATHDRRPDELDMGITLRGGDTGRGSQPGG